MALKRLLDLEQELGRGLERLTRRKGTPREAVELIPEILDEIEHRAEPVGGGVRLFPYNRVVVRVCVPGGRAEAARAVLAHTPSLPERALERLRQAGCDVEDVLVKVQVVESDSPDTAGERGFEIRYMGRRKKLSHNVAPSSETAFVRVASAIPTIRLVVCHGKARRSGYELTLERINLGRMEIVANKSRRTLRRNDVAFLDREDEINLTVSRSHAHIEFRARNGEFRLFDDGSAQGTRVLRDGRCLEVPRRTGRGVKLNHGDEVELGRARIRFLTHWD
jgi:hypothetical protein